MIKNKTDFINYFETYIRPKYNNEINVGVETKKETMKMLRRGIAIFALLTMVPTILFNGFYGLIGAAIFILSLFKLNVLFPEIVILFSKYEKLTISKEKILGEIISSVIPGFTYSYQKSIKKEEFIKYSLMSPNRLDNFSSDSAIIGSLNNQELKISEVSIYEEVPTENSKRMINLFSGLVYELQLELSTDFDMVIGTNKHLEFSNFEKDKSLEEISITNVFLDENYKVLTNDAIKTNKIFQPKNIEYIANIFEQSNANISIGISNGKFIMIVDNQSKKFEIFDEGEFNPEIIWDDIVSIIAYIKYIQKMEIEI
jgi:hypothetical protein